MTTRNIGEGSHLARARATPNGKNNVALYKEWAATYNADVPSDSYAAPLLTAKAALNFGNLAKGLILDAGCGTGLVGVSLANGGAKNIDGLDLSEAMLKEAEKIGIYRNLVEGDMTQPLKIADEQYDIVTCAGTFTHGHVGPDPAFRELVRVTKTNGVVIATVIDDLWLDGGFKDKIEELEAENLIKVISLDTIDYVQARGDHAILVILEKSDSHEQQPLPIQQNPTVSPQVIRV